MHAWPHTCTWHMTWVTGPFLFFSFPSLSVICIRVFASTAPLGWGRLALWNEARRQQTNLYSASAPNLDMVFVEANHSAWILYLFVCRNLSVGAFLNRPRVIAQAPRQGFWGPRPQPAPLFLSAPIILNFILLIFCILTKCLLYTSSFFLFFFLPVSPTNHFFLVPMNYSSSFFSSPYPLKPTNLLSSPFSLSPPSSLSFLLLL